MLKTLLGSAVLLLVATGAEAACPYAGDNGCKNADPDGSFRDVTLLKQAQQSGQTSLLPGHAPPINIPGVDFAIGPSKKLTPRDPRTIKDGVCAYLTSPAPYVGCFGTGVLHDTLDNYDFSGAKIGKPPLTLFLGGSPAAGSSITVTNSYFASPSVEGGQAVGFQGNWSLAFSRNQVDGTHAGFASYPFQDDGALPGTSLEADYNAFIHVNAGRVLNGGYGVMARSYKFNFIQGMNDLNTANHGEVDLESCAARGACPATSALFHAEGNFIIDNSLSADYCANGGGKNGCTNSATFFLSAGARRGLKVSQTDIINNVIVTNTVGAPGTPTSKHIWGQALFSGGWASFGALTITGNWVDATGATGCGIIGPASGNGRVNASRSGSTITISNFPTVSWNNASIEAGWDAYHGGVKVGTLTDFVPGSGTHGGRASYTDNGNPQNIDSDDRWTFVPGHTSATVSGNYNLADPLRTGVPTPIGFTGPTLQATSCLGAHN